MDKGLRRLSAVAWGALGLFFAGVGLSVGFSEEPEGLLVAVVALPLAYAAHMLTCSLVKWVVEGFRGQQ